MQLLCTNNNNSVPTVTKGQELFDAMQQKALLQMMSKESKKRKTLYFPKLFVNSMTGSSGDPSKVDTLNSDLLKQVSEKYFGALMMSIKQRILNITEDNFKMDESNIEREPHDDEKKEGHDEDDKYGCDNKEEDEVPLRFHIFLKIYFSYKLVIVTLVIC
uniref:BESS domain-containing protein n=1 Tax=Strongyloides papillosus TaxID=174720 RepID=A0A0N5C3K2_STREA